MNHLNITACMIPPLNLCLRSPNGKSSSLLSTAVALEGVLCTDLQVSKEPRGAFILLHIATVKRPIISDKRLCHV